MANNEHKINNIFVGVLTGNSEYPSVADKKSNKGITWYKEDSYKNQNKALETAFASASKKMNGQPGRPDFTIETGRYLIIVESKYAETTDVSAKGKHRHGRFSAASDYLNPEASRDDEIYDIETVNERECAIDDVLFYSTFASHIKPVIAVAVSGQNEDDCRISSFYIPKKEKQEDNNLNLALVLEDRLLGGEFKSEKEYHRAVLKALGLEEKLYEDVYEELREYADACAKFLNSNGIGESDRLGIVSAVVLALRNEESDLYKTVVIDDSGQEIRSDNILNALIAEKEYEQGIIVKEDLPIEKKRALKGYFEGLFKMLRSNLDLPVVAKTKKGTREEINTKGFFDFHADTTETLISRLTYSLHEHIIKMYEIYADSNIDVMGTFYSLFLQYAKGDAKKGVVLTPRHITELFCDLTEHYLGRKLVSLSKNGKPRYTEVLDICTGSGGFLIAALNRMDREINELPIGEDKKRKMRRSVREKALMGVELKDSMFVLAYANMYFHKDGRSSLYHGSSILADRQKLAHDMTLEEIIAEKYEGNEDKTGPEIGLINPPYEEDVFEFIGSMLHYLTEGGIGIAIVPINTQGMSQMENKNELLSKHSLLASILMPPDLFKGVRGSGAATSTCILVFRAGKPHQEYLEEGGLTYLADWSVDGFKLVPKHGRFERNGKWHGTPAVKGYKELYLQDLKTPMNEEEFILSSSYKKDIHDAGAKKSIYKPIHKYCGIQTVPKTKDGEPVFKTGIVPVLDESGKPVLIKSGVKKGQPKTTKGLVLDENGQPIQDTEQREVYINEDWNILDYVKTDYGELTDDVFVKSLLKYNLFLYMEENGLLFDDEE